MNAFRKTLTQIPGPVITIGLIGGFVADVLLPLGQIAPWLARISLLCAVTMLVGFIVRYRKQGPRAWTSSIAAIFSISTVSTAIFTILTFILSAGPARGYLAENIGPVEQLQARLLNLESGMLRTRRPTTNQTAKESGPMEIDTAYYHNGVRFSLHFAEAHNAGQLFFSIDRPHPGIDAGKMVSGGQVYVNTIIGPILVDEGQHTFYTQYIDAAGQPSHIYSTTFRIDPIAINFLPESSNRSNNTVSVRFNLGLLGVSKDEPYTFQYSVDTDTLDQSLSGPAVSTIVVEDLLPGDHTLFIQATSADKASQTDVVEYLFTIN